MPDYELVSVTSLKPHPENPRRSNLTAIKDSIAANGFYGALIAQRSTGHVLAGNHRLQAVSELGWTEVPVLWVDCDDAAAKRILVADNRTTDVATYDDKALLDLLESLPTLEGTGYDADDLDDLLATLQELPTPTFNMGTNTYATGEGSTAIIAQTASNTEPSFSEQAQSYLHKGVRSIILDFDIEDFQAIVDAAEKVRNHLGVVTNAELFRTLVETEAAKLAS